MGKARSPADGEAKTNIGKEVELFHEGA